MKLNFLDSMILALFALLGILIWWLRRLRRRQKTTPPAPWRSMVALLFSMVLIMQAGYWYSDMRDEFPLTLIAMLVLGVWGFKDSIQLLFRAQRFKLHAREIPADEIRISAGSSRSSRRQTLLLEYHYLDEYQGRLKIPVQSVAMLDALHERDLHIVVQYLPDDPQVHRVARIEFGRSLEQPKPKPPERQARDPKYNQALILQYLSFLAGLGEGFVIFSDPESGAFVQFAAVGLGSVMLDLPVKALTESQQEKAQEFFLQHGVERPEAVAIDLVAYQMEFSAGPRHIKRASRIGMGVFTDVYELDPTFAMQVEQGE